MDKTEAFFARNEIKMFLILFFILFCGFLVRYHVIGYGIGSGGNFYYSQLVSIVIDGDINLKNQFEQLPFYEKLGSPLFYDKVSQPFLNTPDYINPETSIGPAILWLPFFVVAHLLVLFFNFFGAGLLTNGFSWIHQVLTMAGSILYATLGLYLCYKFASKFYPRKLVFLGVLAITFGFSVVQYVMIEPSISHAATLFTVALFLYYFYEHRQDNSWKKWTLLGFLSGLMMLSRWQEGFFLLVPLIYFLKDFFNRKFYLKDKIALLGKGALFLLIMLFTFFPQMIIWKIFNGGFFSLPNIAQNIMDFTHPWIRLPYFLFSFHHSLFVSTPIIFVAIWGAYFFYKKDKLFTTSLLLTLFVIIYVNSSLVEMGGNAFGVRRMVDSTFIFILFLSSLLTATYSLRRQKWLFYGLLTLIVGLVGFNLLYFLEYNLNLINRAQSIPYSLITEKSKLIFVRLLKFF